MLRVMLEDKVPLLIREFKVSRIHRIINRIYLLLKNKELGLLSLPWHGLVDLIVLQSGSCCGLNNSLFTFLVSFLGFGGLIVKLIKIWELLSGVNHFSLWDKFLSSDFELCLFKAECCRTSSCDNRGSLSDNRSLIWLEC